MLMLMKSLLSTQIPKASLMNKLNKLSLRYLNTTTTSNTKEALRAEFKEIPKVKTIQLTKQTLENQKRFFVYESLKDRVEYNLKNVSNNYKASDELIKFYASIKPQILNNEKTMSKLQLSLIGTKLFNDFNVKLKEFKSVESSLFVYFNNLIVFMIENNIFDAKKVEKSVSSIDEESSSIKEVISKFSYSPLIIEHINLSTLTEDEIDKLYPIVIFTNSIYPLSELFIKNYLEIFTQRAFETLDLNHPVFNKLKTLVNNIENMSDERVIEAYINFVDLFIEHDLTVNSLLSFITPLLFRFLKKYKEVESSSTSSLILENFALTIQEFIRIYTSQTVKGSQIDSKVFESFLLLIIELNTIKINNNGLIASLPMDSIEKLSGLIVKAFTASKKEYFQLDTPIEILFEFQKIFPSKSETFNKLLFENTYELSNVSFRKILFLIGMYGKEYMKDREKLLSMLTKSLISNIINNKTPMVITDLVSPDVDKGNTLTTYEVLIIFKALINYNKSLIKDLFKYLSFNKSFVSLDLNDKVNLEVYSVVLYSAIETKSIAHYFSNPIVYKYISFFNHHLTSISAFFRDIDLNYFPYMMYSLLSLNYEFENFNNKTSNKLIHTLVDYTNFYGLRLSVDLKKILLSCLQLGYLSNQSITKQDLSQLNQKILNLIKEDLTKTTEDKAIPECVTKAKLMLQPSTGFGSDIRIGFTDGVIKVNNELIFLLFQKQQKASEQETRKELYSDKVNRIYLEKILSKRHLLFHIDDQYKDDTKGEKLIDDLYAKYNQGLLEAEKI